MGSWSGLSPSRFHWYPDLAYIGCAQHDLHGAPVVCQIYASKDERRSVLKSALELACQDWIAKVLVRWRRFWLLESQLRGRILPIR